MIMKFSWVITNDRSEVHVKFQGQRSRSQRSKPNLGISRLLTPVWVDIWWWYDAQSLMLLRRGVLLFFRSSARFQGYTAKKSSILTQIGQFRTVTPVWIHPWLWNDAQSLKQHRRGAILFFKVICHILRSNRTKTRRFCPNLGVSGLLLQLEYTNGFEMMHKAWSSIKDMPFCFQGHLSNFKVTRDKKSTIWIPLSEITRPILIRIERFRTVTPVWIHWWLWNDVQSLKQHRRCVLLFFKVIYQIQGHARQKIAFERFRTVTPVWIHWWLWNDAQSLKQHRRGALLVFKVIC